MQDRNTKVEKVDDGEEIEEDDEDEGDSCEVQHPRVHNAPLQDFLASHQNPYYRRRRRTQRIIHERLKIFINRQLTLNKALQRLYR